MELEYRDDRRRGKFIVAIGVLLAVAGGAAAFYVVSQAQNTAGSATLPRVPAVVAVTTIPPRQPIVAEQLTVRDIPLDDTNRNGVVVDPRQVIGRVPAVPILEGQAVTLNLLTSGGTAADALPILDPGETVAPESTPWRAIAITVPPDLAVGGLVQPGHTVDVFVTTVIQLPEGLVEEGRYYSDRSTKIMYQNMLVLAVAGGAYVLKADLTIAEEIAHIQSSGTAVFTLALRPDIDIRHVDAAQLGATTNRLITKYALPIPETYPAGFGPLRTPPPLSTPTPAPEPTPSASPASSPAP